MRREIQLFAMLVFVGSCCSFIAMTIHYQNANTRKCTSSSGEQQSRILLDPIVEMPEKTKQRVPFHVAMTASDSTYSKWQSRIMYYWYMKKKDLPGSEMGKFTRILHTGKPDNLMDEIPTFVVDPLPEGMDQGYVVLNRPWAFVQWLEKAAIEEEYILMAEPDHIFLSPLPNLAQDGFPAAFPFAYIEPTKNQKIMRKFFPEVMGPLERIDPIGNSPVIIKKDLLEIIAPTWMNVSLRMKNDPETDKALDWVQEMYAYAVASALHGMEHILYKSLMLQPPMDLETKGKFILHYTYGCDYNSKGELTYGKIGYWRFDKRSYLDNPPPRNLSLPIPGIPESVVTLVRMINQATADLPNWDTLGVIQSSRFFQIHGSTSDWLDSPRPPSGTRPTSVSFGPIGSSD